MMGFTTDNCRVPHADELLECTEYLVNNGKTVKKWLTLADKYMQSYVAEPDIFIMPPSHKFLTPLVDIYARNTEGFVQYIIMVRDSFSKEDAAWEQVQSVHRRINGRLVQQLRRERSNRAIAKAETLYGETDYHTRLQWVSALEHGWAKRRLAFLNDWRKKSAEPRLDVETRAELLAEFWDIIDTEIYEAKELPPWN